MSYLSVQEKIQCLKNLLADPDDWISEELLRLANEKEQQASDPSFNTNPKEPSR